MTKRIFPNIFIILFLCGITYFSLPFLLSENIRIVNNIQHVTGKIRLFDEKASQTLHVDIATTPLALNQGLMYRKKWDDIQGMPFVFDDEAPRNFWMKNTYLPLDIVFFDAMGRLVHVAKNTTPLSQELVPSLLPAQYVLELPAGDADMRGLTSDSKLDLTSLQALLP